LTCVSSRQDRSGRQGRAERREAGFVVLVLALVLAIGAALFWLVGTSSGAATALRLAIDFTGNGHARGVQGSLLQGLSIEDLEYSHPRLDVRAQGLQLDVEWPALKD